MFEALREADKSAAAAVALQGELWLNFSDGLAGQTAAVSELAASRFGDDLDPVVECHTKNEFCQLIVAIEAAPAFLRAVEQFEDRREAVLLDRHAFGTCDGARWRRCFRWDW